jgi:hypothetical protein
MEAGRRLANATLGEALRRHGLLKQSKAWQAARTIRDKKGRSSEFQRLSKEAGFTPAALITFARTCKNEAGWKDRLGANVVQRIAERVFSLSSNTPLDSADAPALRALTARCTRWKPLPTRRISSGKKRPAASCWAT